MKYLFSNYLDAKKILLDVKEINNDFVNNNLKENIEETNNVFELIDLEVGYKNKSLFKINLVVKKGEIIIFKGRNGLGKTTLFNTLMGKQEKLSGKIKKNKNYKYVYVSNLDHCFEFDTAKNNITLLNKKVEETFDNKFDQSINYLNNEGINLSGGEKERVVTIRKILRDFDVILFDEPLKENDLQNKDFIWKYLIENKENKTFLLITHSDYFDKYASRILNIDKL